MELTEHQKSDPELRQLSDHVPADERMRGWVIVRSCHLLGGKQEGIWWRWQIIYNSSTAIRRGINYTNVFKEGKKSCTQECIAEQEDE